MNARRLPVYLVIDCSESMGGLLFDAVQNGIQTLVIEIYSDPIALETVALSVITFSANAKVAVPLTEVTNFKKPKLVLGSRTSLGLALDLVTVHLRQEVCVQTKEVKGDWKPLIFILPDGNLTDTWFDSADRFKSQISGKSANVIAVACGPEAQFSNLRLITDVTLAFKSPTVVAFSQFFKWVSQSVKITSTRCREGVKEGIALPDLPECLEMVTEGFHVDYGKTVFIMAQCQNTKGLYIMKYEQIPEEVLQDVRRQGAQIARGNEMYCGSSSHPIDVFDFSSDGNIPSLSVPSDSLVMSPACPYCKNPAWAFDGSCGNLFCIGKPGRHTCPWCLETDDYGITDESFHVTH